MRNVLYRFLDTDDDGDPIDWGIVSADDIETATETLAAHLYGLGSTENGGTFPAVVRVYPLDDKGGQHAQTFGGLWPTTGYEELTLQEPEKCLSCEKPFGGGVVRKAFVIGVGHECRACYEGDDA